MVLLCAGIYLNWLYGSDAVDLTKTLDADKIMGEATLVIKDGVDLPDITLAVLEYDHALARIFVSSVEVDGHGRRQFAVFGSNGTASALPIETPVTMTWSDRTIATNPYRNTCVPVDVKDIPGNCRYDDMVQDFYAYVMGTKENPFTYEHEYAVQEVLDEVVGGICFHGRDIG